MSAICIAYFRPELASPHPAQLSFSATTGASSAFHGQPHCEAHDRSLPRGKPARRNTWGGSTATHRRDPDHAGDADLAYGLSPDSIVRFKPKTKLRIVVLLSQELMPPETIP